VALGRGGRVLGRGGGAEGVLGLFGGFLAIAAGQQAYYNKVGGELAHFCARAGLTEATISSV